MVGLLYADPPWAFRSRAGGSWRSGAAAHYDTLTAAAIADLPVRPFLAPAAVAALWVPASQKGAGLAVLEAWGFRYRVTVYWVKTGRLGMGFWFRNQVEELLIGTRGPVRAFRSSARNVIQAPAGRHSAKPAEARALLESVAPAGARVEVFARAGVPGWIPIGLECNGRDARDPAAWRQALEAGVV